MRIEVVDVIYLHQAMQQPDKTEIIKEIIKESDTHQERNHKEIV